MGTVATVGWAVFSFAPHECPEASEQFSRAF